MNPSPDNLTTRQPDNLRIAFLGSPRFSQIILEKLIDSEFKPQLIITGVDEKTGRGRKVEPTPVKQTAEKHNIKVIQPKNLSEPNFKFEILNLKFDLAILVAYGKIIPKEILDIPKFGFLNVHPSLLPLYRGPSPIQSAILDGAKVTGITIMKLDEELDHGPILAQSKIKIETNDTHQTLAEKLANLGSELLISTLPKYLEFSGNDPSITQGRTPLLTPQHHIDATWTEKIEKESGKIDTNNPPDPQTLDRMIRAYFPWPTVWFEIESKRYKLLPENKIQPEGKKPMTIKEFQNGYPALKSKIEKLFN